ncbi:unnamed protein product [Withania somnifera]
MILVIREEFNIWKSKKGLVPSDISRLNVSIQVENPPSSTTNWSLGEDHTILQALFNIDMLILFVATTLGVGGTLTSIDNLGQIGKALGYPDSSIGMFVSLVTQWPLILSIISELFGLKYYATLHNFVASPIGGYILNVRVAGHLYDKEALRQLEAKGIFTRKIGEDLNCVGVQCYKQAFLIISGATFVGAIVSLILVLRTRKFYESDIYKKFKEESQVVHGTIIVTSREND